MFNNNAETEKKFWEKEWATQSELPLSWYIERKQQSPKRGYEVLEQIDMNGKRVLDIGAASGFVGWLCQEKGADVTLLDITGVLFPSWMKGIIGNKENMPFADSSFDIVVCMDTLHHGDLQKTLDEVYRVLIPGGEFCSIQEPLISTEENEEDIIRKDCLDIVEAGVDERRPNINDYRKALSIFGNYQILSGIDLQPAVDYNYGGMGIVITATRIGEKQI
jgi:SAM-dependent methyltransferase